MQSHDDDKPMIPTPQEVMESLRDPRWIAIIEAGFEEEDEDCEDDDDDFFQRGH